MSLANAEADSFEGLLVKRDLQIKNLEKELDKQSHHQSCDEKQHEIDMDKGKSTELNYKSYLLGK